VVLSPIRL